MNTGMREGEMFVVVPQALDAFALLWLDEAPQLRAEALALLHAGLRLTDDKALRARLNRRIEQVSAGTVPGEQAILSAYLESWQRKLSDAEAMEVKLKRAARQRDELAARKATEAEAARDQRVEAAQRVVRAAMQAAPRKPQVAPEPTGLRDALLVAVAAATLIFAALLIRSANRR